MNEEPFYSNGEPEYGVPLGQTILESRQVATRGLYQDIREYIMRKYWTQRTNSPSYGDIEILEEELRNMIDPQEFEALEFYVYELYISALPTLGERSRKPGDIHEGPIPYREMEPMLAEIGGAQYADILREM